MRNFVGVSVRIVILALMILYTSKSHAEELTANRGEVFTMPCFTKPATNFYVDLEFKPSTSTTSTSPVIAKFNPDSGSVNVLDSKFNGRITFSLKTNVGDANTVSISSIRIDDEGTYTCIVRSFDIINNLEESSSLVVYVPPIIEGPKLIINPLIADEQMMNVASCTAKNGKPDATVEWFNERLLFNDTSATQPGSDSGTNTVTSTLKLAPTKFYNNQAFLCKISHPALKQDNVTMIKLNVHYPPSVPLIEPINDKTQLKCTADSNPPPTIKWTMPDGVTTQDSDIAPIISPSDPARQNDTYICTASNGIGSATSSSITTADAVSYVEIVNTSNTGVIVGAVVGSLVILLLIGVLVYWFFIRKHREKDSGPYNPNKMVRPTEDDEGGWSRSSGRPIIQHANESLNKNAPPSPSHPPPQEEDDASDNSQSDVEEFTEGHDVDLNSPLTGVDDEDVGGAIVSKNSVNFQPYWRNSVAEHRRQRPSTSPHRHSQNRGYRQPEPAPRTPQTSDPHYEVPPKEYYEDDEYDQDDAHLMADQRHPQDDDRFYDLPEDRYPGYQPRYDEPPHHEGHLPPYTDNTVQYASIDHEYNGKPRTRPPYHEPVEYAEIRSKGQIV
ncbi:uncharacterized protein LOC120325713 isoform X2 [Styela clava]